MENSDTAPASKKLIVCGDIRSESPDLASRAACLPHPSRELLSLPSHSSTCANLTFQNYCPPPRFLSALPPLTALPRRAAGLLPACVTRCRSVRDIGTKRRRLGGLHSRNFSQFWRLRVPDRGVGRFGFFCGLSAWLMDGHLLLCPPVVFSLYLS